MSRISFPHIWHLQWFTIKFLSHGTLSAKSPMIMLKGKWGNESLIYCSMYWVFKNSEIQFSLHHLLLSMKLKIAWGFCCLLWKGQNIHGSCQTWALLLPRRHWKPCLSLPLHGSLIIKNGLVFLQALLCNFTLQVSLACWLRKRGCKTTRGLVLTVFWHYLSQKHLSVILLGCPLAPVPLHPLPS